MGWGPKAPDMTAANTAAASQAAIAQDQWNTQKQYLPEAMALARDQNARAQRAADLAEKDSEYYRGITQHQFDRSKLSEKYQDRLFGLADEYDSGARGEEEAGRAAADVEQAYGSGLKTMMRGAGRYGLNAGSDGFAAAMGDMALQKAADAAGAQTNARRWSRDKAEQMVALAAGQGAVSFGQGINAGGMTGSAAGQGVGFRGAGVSGINSVNQTYNAGMSSAGSGFGSAGANYRANAIESAKNPGFDFMAGLATAGLRGWAGRP